MATATATATAAAAHCRCPLPLPLRLCAGAQAFQRVGVNANLVALVNDTVGTLAAGKYEVSRRRCL